jgi:hypothetical protein
MRSLHLDDRVRGVLVDAIGSGDSTLDVEISGAVWQAPPAPAPGRVGLVLLLDDLQSPGAAELVTYTGRTDLGGSQWQLTGLERGALGTSAASWSAGAAVVGTLTAAAATPPGRNLLANPDGVVNQYNHASAVADETYGLDRWCVLADSGQDITPSSDTTDTPPGSPSSILLAVGSASGKFAVVQYLEAADCVGLIGREVSVQVRAKASGVGSIGLAVLSWTGTADAITRDVVSAWGAVSAVPTWATNWTEEASTIVSAPSAWGAPITLEGVAIDAGSAVQVALVVWSDDDSHSAGSDELRLAAAKLEEGPRATPYEARAWLLEWLECRRWKQRSYLPNLPDGDTSGFKTYGATRCTQPAAVTKLPGLEVRFEPMMRTTPTVTFYAPNTGTAGNIYNLTTSADVALSSVHITNRLVTGAPVASAAPAAGDDLSAQFVAAAEL